MEQIVEQIPYLKEVLMILGMLVICGTTYVKLSPSKSDDAFLAKVEAIPVLGHLIKFVKAFSAVAPK